jgi:hypothetical protein
MLSAVCDRIKRTTPFSGVTVRGVGNHPWTRISFIASGRRAKQVMRLDAIGCLRLNVLPIDPLMRAPRSLRDFADDVGPLRRVD